MNIGIDARFFGPKAGGGGLGRYVEQLVRGLEAADAEHQYVIFLKPEAQAECQFTNPRFKKRLAPIPWYTIKEHLFLAPLIDREKLDLVHFPHWNVPIGIKTPFIVTIHDLILLEEPMSSRASTRHPISYAIRHFLFRIILGRAIERSVKIIAVSQYTKDAIRRFFPKTPAEKICVIHEGVTPMPSAPASETLATTPYLLHVGNAYPHKNLDFLVRAFAKFHTIHPEFTLVLAGRDDFFLNRLKSETKNPHVRFVFDPTDADLANLYQHASLLVFPSRTEGFGLPALEAMAFGLPVICSNGGSLPEIVGQAALFFDPANESELISQIETAIQHPQIRERLIGDGRRQAAKYSWKKMVQETQQLYVWRKKT